MALGRSGRRSDKGGAGAAARRSARAIPPRAKIADGIRAAGRFSEPERWQFDWECSYSTEQWLDQLPTLGSLTRVPPDKLATVLEAVGTAIDSLGGSFTMAYTTVAVTAARTGAA
jgi:hypothetical protein